MESSIDKRRKLIEKIRALFAMTVDRGASEAEAMNAAVLASKLMQEHDLTYDDIEGELRDERYGARSRKFSNSNRLHESHQCADQIGKCWDCKAWFGYDGVSGETHLVFFGSADDTNLAHDMMQMIRSATENSWQAYKISNARDYAVNGRSLRADFMSGMVTTIVLRLMDLKAARTGRGDTSRALVVAKDAIVQERFEIFAKQNGMNITEKPASYRDRDVNASAFAAGIQAGEEVRLQEELSGE